MATKKKTPAKKKSYAVAAPVKRTPPPPPAPEPTTKVNGDAVTEIIALAAELADAKAMLAQATKILTELTDMCDEVELPEAARDLLSALEDDLGCADDNLHQADVALTGAKKALGWQAEGINGISLVYSIEQDRQEKVIEAHKDAIMPLAAIAKLDRWEYRDLIAGLERGDISSPLTHIDAAYHPQIERLF